MHPIQFTCAVANKHEGKCNIQDHFLYFQQLHHNLSSEIRMKATAQKLVKVFHPCAFGVSGLLLFQQDALTCRINILKKRKLYKSALYGPRDWSG
jgi:hypothetical protein